MSQGGVGSGEVPGPAPPYGKGNAVLGEADRTLTRWLGSVLPDGVAVRSGAPDARWLDQAATAPFVGAFLHRVLREGPARQSSWVDVRDERGVVIGRQAPLQHFRLVYLITAWEGPAGDPAGRGATSAGAEAALSQGDLLGAVLNACAVCESVPPEYVEGLLARSGAPVIMLSAPGEPSVGEPPWAGWNISPRTYLRLDLLAALLPPMSVDVAPPAREITLDVERGPAPNAAGRGIGRRPGAVGPGGWEKRTITERSAAAPRSPEGH